MVCDSPCRPGSLFTLQPVAGDGNEIVLSFPKLHQFIYGISHAQGTAYELRRGYVLALNAFGGCIGVIILIEIAYIGVIFIGVIE